MWEAQFGDFINGAMTIVDEFIASGEAKWGQRSGVTLLLPHGYEGQGPDHSSMRIERFLQLCAEDNMTVAYPTTPAQHFHLLRAQALIELHRPLVVVTPKSMLRLKAAVSAPQDFTSGRWQPVLDDPDGLDPAEVTRIVLCSGKVFYDLLAARRKAGLTDVALVRMEQLYPLPAQEVADRGRPLQLRRGPGLGAGGAGQPGRLGARRPVAAGRAARAPAAAPGLASGRRLAGRRLEQGARGRAGRARAGRPAGLSRSGQMYSTDRGIEELAERRGDETVALAWLAGRMVEFVDLNPEFEVAVDRLATWLARLDDDE